MCNVHFEYICIIFHVFHYASCGPDMTIYKEKQSLLQVEQLTDAS